MRLKSLKLALALALALVPVVAMSGTAQAAPDHTITLAAGSQSWSGAAADGENQNYQAAAGTPCPDAPTGPGDYCEQTLLNVTAATPANVDVSLADDPTQDFDLYIYSSDSSATRGTLVDSSANPQTLLEVATITGAQPNSYYLIQVVYSRPPPRPRAGGSRRPPRPRSSNTSPPPARSTPRLHRRRIPARSTPT